jgi:hypothetical protein
VSKVFHLDTERDRDYLRRVPIRVLDDPRRVGEDAEELIVRDDQAGFLANFALERISQGFVIFHPSGHERPPGWIEPPV